MRDPQRIERMIHTLRVLWNRYPSLRLGQLLCNASGSFEGNTYNCEDSVLEQDLEYYAEFCALQPTELDYETFLKQKRAAAAVVKVAPRPEHGLGGVGGE